MNPQIRCDGEQEVKALIVSPLLFPSDQLLGVLSCSRNKPIGSSPCAMELEHDTVSAGRHDHHVVSTQRVICWFAAAQCWKVLVWSRAGGWGDNEG